nr:hypothetical protein [Tanacetum cinerariifolium]
PSVTLLKEYLSLVPVWVKFHDVSLVAYTSNGLSLVAKKIDHYVEYDWKPPRCSACLIVGHSLANCPKAPKRVVNKMDKGANQNSTHSVGKKNVSTSGKGTFSLMYSFEALNVEKSFSEEVEMGDEDSEDEIEYVENEMTSYLASKLS